MAMSPRKKMAMGKSADGKSKPAVKLKCGGAVKKMRDGGAVSESPRPKKNPRRPSAVDRGNSASERENQEYDDVLMNGGRGRRRMRMGGMVKK